MNDISLNKKKKNIKFFDEKKYEMINSFNLDFICNKVDNILSIYEEDKRLIKSSSFIKWKILFILS